jgi:predicted MPP superfamily phosphohydrolase
MSLRRRTGIALVAAVIAVSAVVVAMGLQSAVATPIERQTVVHLPVQALREHPMRIALVSDIHVGNRAMTVERLNRIIDQINAARPDAVLITGDFVNGGSHKSHDFHPELLAVPLARLRAPMGVYATLGNHDHWTDATRTMVALRTAGIIVLTNEARRIGAVTLVGIDDSFSKHAAIANAMAAAKALGGVPVVFTHSPDIAPQLPPDVPLLLAGHTHCGQIVLPLIGPPVTRSPRSGEQIYNPRYRCGVVHDATRTVIVTGGVGSGTIPIRIGAPPDWWLVTLTGT